MSVTVFMAEDVINICNKWYYW